MGAIYICMNEHHLLIRTAERDDDWAVHRLFGALHQLNAELDDRFALADGWPAVLDEHLAHVRAVGNGITLLAWHDQQPVGLLMMDGHSDSPLFRHRRWAELIALYVEPAARALRVADQILASGAEWVQERGYDRIQLYVTASNDRAKRFYERSGFRCVQEIWRLDLTTPAEPSLPDPTCEEAYAHGHHLLSIHPHQLIHDPSDHSH